MLTEARVVGRQLERVMRIEPTYATWEVRCVFALLITWLQTGTIQAVIRQRVEFAQKNLPLTDDVRSAPKAGIHAG